MLLGAIVVVSSCVAIVVGLDLSEYAQGIITLVIGRFLGYIDNGFAFEYGTTRGSKEKDVVIADLSSGTGPAIPPVSKEGEK